MFDKRDIQTALKLKLKLTLCDSFAQISFKQGQKVKHAAK